MTNEQLSAPDISVVVPAYNPGEPLRETLDSILAQQDVNCEVIVVDDGSTDATQEVLASYGDRVRSLRIENSGGPSTPRNVGVEAAAADLIAFFDADDLMLPGKLAAAVAAMRAAPSVGLLCTDFRGIDTEGRVFRESWLAEYRMFRRNLAPGPVPDSWLLKDKAAYRELLRANYVGTSSVVCRAETLRQVGPFVQEMKNGDDREMWLRISRSGWGFLFLDRVYHSYRRGEGGVTNRGGARNLAGIECMTRQLPHLVYEDDRRHVLKVIQSLWRGYGYHLRRAGDRRGACEAYRKAMGYGFDLVSVYGWLRAKMGI